MCCKDRVSNSVIIAEKVERHTAIPKNANKMEAVRVLQYER